MSPEKKLATSVTEVCGPWKLCDLVLIQIFDVKPSRLLYQIFCYPFDPFLWICAFPKIMHWVMSGMIYTYLS